LIVCICHAVPESAVVQAAAAGLTAAEIAERTRAGTSCGCCREEVETIVAAAHRCDGSAAACLACPRRRGAPASRAGIPEREAA
jgi:bacterioferritin-associated ferredoxin